MGSRRINRTMKKEIKRVTTRKERRDSAKSRKTARRVGIVYESKAGSCRVLLTRMEKIKKGIPFKDLDVY